MLRHLLLFLLSALLGACADVQPWERGALAKPHMAVTPHPLHTGLMRHVRDSREAAPGGSAGQGGGCGCN
jgi:hypothetical protein